MGKNTLKNLLQKSINYPPLNGVLAAGYGEKSTYARDLKKKISLVIVSSVLAVLLLGCSSAPQQQTKQQSPASEAPLEIPRVGLEESKAAFDTMDATFIDVRSESSYAASHIPGALSIPLAEFEAHIGELDPNQWIITYCT